MTPGSHRPAGLRHVRTAGQALVHKFACCTLRLVGRGPAAAHSFMEVTPPPHPGVFTPPLCHIYTAFGRGLHSA